MNLNKSWAMLMNVKNVNIVNISMKLSNLLMNAYVRELFCKIKLSISWVLKFARILFSAQIILALPPRVLPACVW